MGSFTLKVAGDAGIYSVQEVDLTGLAKLAAKRLAARAYWARSFGQVRSLGKVRPEVHI